MTAKISLADTARTIFTSVLAECRVENAFLSKFDKFNKPDNLDPEIGASSFTVRGATDEAPAHIDLKAFTRVIVIAAGKGAAPMLTGLLSRLRLPVSCRLLGILIAPMRPPDLPQGSFRPRVITLLSAADLAQAARRHAESLGFTVTVDNSCDDWDYRPAVIFSAGSDGIDGNSPYAGAVLDYDLLHSTAASPSEHLLEPSNSAQQALAHFDSSTFLHRIGATLETGPTGNNLRDLRLFLVE